MSKTSRAPTLFVREATGLVRELGPFSVFTYTFTDIVSSGINYFVPKFPSIHPGADPFVSIAIAAIPAILGAIAITMVLSAMPRAGGHYTIFTRTLDPSIGNLFGGIVGWVLGFACVAWFLYLSPIFLGTTFVIAGDILKWGWLVDVGITMSEELWAIFAVGFVLFVIFTLIDMLGSRWMKWSINIMFIIYMVGALLAIGLLVMNTPTSAATAWDKAWGTGAYNQIVSESTALNWSKAPFSWDAVHGSLATSFWAFVGFEFVAPLGSEIREPKKSMFWGSIVATIFIAVWYLIIAGSLYRAYGMDFISRYDHVYYNAPDSFWETSIMPKTEPSLPLFAASLSTNSAIQLTTSIGISFGVINAIPSCQAFASRTIFAMGFDRYLPEGLTSVGRIFRGPKWAALVTGIAGFIGIYFFYKEVWIGVWNMTAMESMLYLFTGFAALSIPFKRPDIWEKGFKYTIAGIPLMAIIGALSMATTGLWMMLVALISMDLNSIIWTWVMLLIGALIYVGYSQKNRKMGIDISKLFYELPPE